MIIFGLETCFNGTVEAKLVQGAGSRKGGQGAGQFKEP